MINRHLSVVVDGFGILILSLIFNEEYISICKTDSSVSVFVGG